MGAMRWTSIRGVALAAALMVACEPVTRPATRIVPISLQPSFQPVVSNQQDGSPASNVDNIRVVFTNADGETVVDTVIPWPADQDTLYAEIGIEVSGEETFSYVVEARQGSQVLFAVGPVDVTLSVDDGDGGGTPVVVTPELVYVGPGAMAAAIEIGGPPTIAAGTHSLLTATVTDSGGANITDSPVTWSSVDTLAAIVDGDGLVTARYDLSRTVTIVARVPYTAVADTFTMTLLPARLVASPEADTINAIGFFTVVEAEALALGGVTATGGTIAWSSQDTAIARVARTSADGRRATVVGRTTGSVPLLATAGGLVDTVTVVVRQVPAGAGVVPTDVLLGVGDAVSLTGVSVDSAGVAIPGATFGWSSASGSVSIDASGTVTGVAAGTATVEAVSGSLSAAATVTVASAATAQVAVGDEHVCELDTAGSASCWGTGDAGQLGHGAFEDADAPQPVAGGITFTALAAGGNHTCGLAQDSTAWCWGENSYGQLGDGSVTRRDTPVAVLGGLKLVSITAGGRHTCGLEADGTAHCWGDNSEGQVGDGLGTSAYATPVLVAGGASFTQLAAGWLHTCGLTGAGAVYCWGRGDEGQLGDGTLTSSDAPVALPGLTLTSLDAGAAHTCGLDAAGVAHCWGYNSSGQAGAGAEVVASTPVTVGATSYTAIAAGWIHSCGVRADGVLECWGSNVSLQLGRASPVGSRTPLTTDVASAPLALEAGGLRSCALTGTALACWGAVPPEELFREGAVPTVPEGDPRGF